MSYLAHPTPAEHLDPTDHVDDWAYTDTPTWAPPPNPTYASVTQTHRRPPADHELTQLEIALTRKTRGRIDFTNLAYPPRTADEWKHHDRAMRERDRENQIAAQQARVFTIRALYHMLDQGLSHEDIATFLGQPIAVVAHMAAGTRPPLP